MNGLTLDRYLYKKLVQKVISKLKKSFKKLFNRVIRLKILFSNLDRKVPHPLSILQNFWTSKSWKYEFTVENSKIKSSQYLKYVSKNKDSNHLSKGYG